MIWEGTMPGCKSGHRAMIIVNRAQLMAATKSATKPDQQNTK